MSLPDELRDGKIGRFPVWAIGVVIAGAIILFMVIRNRSRETVGTQETGANDPVLTDSVDGIPSASFADQLSGNYPANLSLAVQPERPQTNAQWLIAAFDYLVGASKDPALVERALQNYLAGKLLTDAERQLVNMATANSALSLPPEGVVLAPLPPAPGSPLPPGSPPPPGNNVPTHVPVPRDTNLYVWVEGLDSGYNLGWGGTAGDKFVRMFGRFNGDLTALNPGARKYMTWTGSGTKIPMFKGPTPQMRIR